MSFPYDTPFTNNNKVDLDTFPAVPAVNKMLATEVNPLISGVNALATAVTAGRFLGLAGEAAPDVAPAGGVRIKAGAAGPEFSFNGGAYAPIGGGGDTVSIEPFGATPSDGGATNADGAITMQPCDGTHPGMVSEADQVLGAGRKTLPGAVLFLSDPTAPVSAAGGMTIRNNAGSPEISTDGGAFTALLTGTGTPDTPQVATSTAGHIALSLSAHLNYYHATTENTTLDAPTNAAAGQAGVIEFVQGATPRTLAFNAFWKFSGGIAPALTATGSKRDTFVYYVNYGSASATCRLINNVS